MKADRRRKEVQSPPICAFSLTTQMGAIIRTEINHSTQNLYRQVSFPRRHLHQDPVQCQREISLRILENHCGVEPWFDQTQCPSFPAPVLKTGICLLIFFAFQFVFLSKGSLLPPLPMAPPDWIPRRAPGGPVLQADLREPFRLFHIIHLSGKWKLLQKCSASRDLITTSSKGMGFHGAGTKHLNSTLRQQRHREHDRQVIEIK